MRGDGRTGETPRVTDLEVCLSLLVLLVAIVLLSLAHDYVQDGRVVKR